LKPARLLTPAAGVGRWAAIAALAAIAAAAFAALLLGLSGWLISASALAGAGLLAGLEIFAPGAGIRAGAVGRTVARYLEKLFGHEAMFRQLAAVRRAAFALLLRRPVAELERLRRDDTLNRLTRDVDTLDQLLPGVMLPAAAALGVSVAAFVVLLAFGAPLAGVVAAAFAAAWLLVLVPGSLATRRCGRRLAVTTPRMRETFGQWLTGLAELISLDQAATRARAIAALSDRQVAAGTAQRRIEALMHGALLALGYLGFWGVLWGGLNLYARGLLTAPVTAAAALVAFSLVEAWLPLAAGASRLTTLHHAAARIRGLESNDAVSAGMRSGSKSARRRLPRDAALVARDVGFRWEVTGAPILQSLDLRVEPGRHIAIHGASGGGKSTLARLLAGVLAPCAGQLLLDGTPLAGIAPSVLRGHIGLLTQQVTLFNDTLAANLRLAAPDAEKGRMFEALEMLELRGLVGDLPGGLDGWLGEHGRAVSGGEARRIALARMILADFPLLILDEPTAGLDAATAARIGANLDGWLRDRSVVLLSHDIATLPRVDRVFELRSGQLQPVPASSGNDSGSGTGVEQVT